MTVNDASLGESGSKLSKVAATSLLMGVTRASSEAYRISNCELARLTNAENKQSMDFMISYSVFVSTGWMLYKAAPMLHNYLFLSF